jgi:hypothetical protein
LKEVGNKLESMTIQDPVSLHPSDPIPTWTAI